MSGRILNSRLILAAAALAVLAVGSTIAADRSSSAMASAATKFLDSLTPDQRQEATFAFNADERLRWHFIPTEMYPRKGLLVKQMTEPQRRLAHDLLKAGLSQRGYMTASQIMDLETVLDGIEAAQRTRETSPRGQPLVRDPEKYFFSIFGTPSTHDTWGWRVEGHHVSLHFNVVNGSLVAAAPTFFGSNPAEVREGPKKGLRILGAEEDGARALVESLDASQREKAIFRKEAPGDIITMANVKIDPLAPEGIPMSALNANQRALLTKLIDVYTGYMRQETLLPRAGADVPHRVRQHPERREPHPLGVARLQWRLWTGSVARPREVGRTLTVQHTNW